MRNYDKLIVRVLIAAMSLIVNKEIIALHKVATFLHVAAQSTKKARLIL